MAPLNILIVGCGVAGPTLASFLLLSPHSASQKPRVTILERSSEVKARGQNIDIRGAGVTIIRKLGLETMIRSSTTGEEGVQLVDSENRVWGAFAADKSGKTQTPTSDIEILRGRLAQICWNRSQQISEKVEKEGGRGIEYLFGDTLDELEQDGDQVHVHFQKSGKRRSFDLVVGADGLQSRTRKMVWGAEGETERVKRLGAYGGFFSMPRGETDSDWRRWYHAPGGRGIMIRPDERKDRSTVFMSLVKEGDSRLIDVATNGHSGIDAQKSLMEEYFWDAGWESKRVIHEMNATDDFYYDLIGQVKMDRWSKGRVVLLGDAGYCASPFSGMGTTLALNGAYTLAGVLVRFPNDFDAAFTEYEKQMRPTVERAQKLAPGMPNLLHPQSAWGVWVLNAIMYFFTWSGLISVLSKFAGPPANNVPVEDYGFEQLPELKA